MKEKGKRSQTTRSEEEEEEEEEEIKKEVVGQGVLYSPNYAMRISTNKQDYKKKQELSSSKSNSNMGVGTDIKKNLGALKVKLLEKLAAASVPADALDNVKHFLEGVIRDVTVTAHGLTKDALHRIRTHLLDILPSLSPSFTNKMLEEAEREANSSSNEQLGEKQEEKMRDGDHHHQEKNELVSSGKQPYASPTSSLFATMFINKPTSRL